VRGVPDEQQILAGPSSELLDKIPADLIVIVIWLAAAIGAVYLIPSDFTLLRVILVIPVILFIPGYCLLIVLFPRKGDIGLMTRIVLSIGISIAIVPLIGLGLNFTPWGIRLDPIVLSLALFTVVITIVACYQKTILSSEEQFGISFSGIATFFRQEYRTKSSTRVEQTLNTALVLAILICIVIAVFVLTVPREGETYTEFFILGENRTAADYPNLIVPGQEYSMYVGVVNHEYREIHYTIETWLLLTEFDNATNRSRIIAMDPSDRLSFTLAHNETTIVPYQLSVKKAGYNRVEFLLFKDSEYSPELTGSDRINASYRDLHLTITTL
jgi:uncharacterized membrane protein